MLNVDYVSQCGWWSSITEKTRNAQAKLWFYSDVFHTSRASADRFDETSKTTDVSLCWDYDLVFEKGLAGFFIKSKMMKLLECRIATLSRMGCWSNWVTQPVATDNNG